ncbi:thioredoxin-dependent thiol peroxidase [soil metagenome]
MKRQKNKLVSAIFAGALTTVAATALQAAEPLEVGANAPDVSAVDQNGEKINIGEIAKSGTTLVYFYPKADTPGCTKQACSLRDAYAELSEKGVRVIGVSMDGPEAQKAFEKNHNLPFTLVADEEGKVVEAFGVPQMRPGIASRQAFLIRDGKVIWRDLKASTDQQAADVLAALEGEQ